MASVEPSLLLIKKVADLIDDMSNLPFRMFFRRKEVQDVRKAQLLLLQDLSEAGVDAKLFDSMLSNELDRELKKRFGIAFFLATIAFTCASYAIVVANSVYKWGINDIAITALIIETPLQFIGLLYIIARNLFPQHEGRRPISSMRQRSRPSTTIGGAAAQAEMMAGSHKRAIP